MKINRLLPEPDVSVTSCLSHLQSPANLLELKVNMFVSKTLVKGFKEILEGKWDHLPEQAFHNVGTIEEAVEKAKTLTE